MDEPNKREVRDFSKYDIVFDLDGGPKYIVCSIKHAPYIIY